MKRFILIAAVLLSAVGCTSFRTTALYRFANDSVVPQKTNKKLKGLPVKLKVPSHVQVTVYEQQVILAPSKLDESKAQEAAADAKKAVDGKKGQLKKLDDEVSAAKETYEAKSSEVAYLEARLTAGVTKAEGDAIDLMLGNGTTPGARLAKETARRDFEAKTGTRDAQSPRLRVELAQLEGILAEKIKALTPNYTLVSFTPAQYFVERELQYTDKVFLVDFKRPAGGVLDVTEASMDDEQYFAKVQAKITERTLQDVGAALKTVGDPLSKFGKKDKDNQAIPTSSDTPVAESNNNVNFQKSVIATQRFDISEAGWEERLQAFVSEFIAVDNGQTALPSYPLEVAPEHSGGQVLSSVYGVHSGAN